MPVYKDSRRGTYFYSFSHEGRRVRSKDFDNRKDCEKALASALLNADALSPSGYTFGQVAELFLAEKKDRLKRQSYDRCETMLGHFLVTLGDVRVDRLTVQQYSKALQYLDSYEFHGRKLKNSYKNKVVRNFRTMCDWARRRYDLYTNVPEKFDPYRNEEREEMKILTLDQFNALLDVCNEEPWRSLFITLYYMGLRIGEANALTWADIDFEAGTLSVNKTLTTKIEGEDGHYLVTSPKTRSSARTLPMPHIVSASLSALRDKVFESVENPAQTFVFGGQCPIPESTLQKKKEKYLKEAGLPVVRLHDFRHSCASFLINNGATPLLVSKWLGHASVTMTLDVYSHLWSNELNEIVRVIDEKN